MTKNILFCADGTWNDPDQDENADQTADPTNVYKLFLCLAGALSVDSLRNADEQEREVTGDGATRQVAKYIHGVGDSRNPIVKLMGGAFGAGVISRVVRGYTFISRNYEEGADIHIVGFSRGAYTARALAGLIASQGLLAPRLTRDRELSYRCGAQAWYRYRHAALDSFSLAHLAEIVADLPAFLSNGTLKDEDLIPVDRIATVARRTAAAAPPCRCAAYRARTSRRPGSRGPRWPLCASAAMRQAQRRCSMTKRGSAQIVA